MQKINATMARVVATPEMKEQLALQGAEPATGTPEEFRKAIREELDRDRQAGQGHRTQR